MHTPPLSPGQQQLRQRHYVAIAGEPWLRDKSIVPWFLGAAVSMFALATLLAAGTTSRVLPPQQGWEGIAFLLFGGAVCSGVIALIMGVMQGLGGDAGQVCPDCLCGMPRGAAVCPHCGFRPLPAVVSPSAPSQQHIR